MTPYEALRRTLEVHKSVDVGAVVRVFGVREAEVEAELVRLGFVEDGDYWRQDEIQKQETARQAHRGVPQSGNR